jgi:tRNA 2-thiouridine synthesizing protein A
MRKLIWRPALQRRGALCSSRITGVNRQLGHLGFYDGLRRFILERENFPELFRGNGRWQMTVLDTSGLKCPLPVLKAKKALKSLAPGDELSVIATDPQSPQDFRHFCETTGDDLVEVMQENGVFTYRIKKR